MLTEAELLFGVKTTLKRLAENPDCSWHVFNDMDASIGPSASAGVAKAAIEARTAKGFPNENRMIVYFIEVTD